MAVKLMLNGVRCAFLVLGEPEQYQGKGPFRWSAVGLVPKTNTAMIASVEKALKQAAEEKWGVKHTTHMKAILTDPKGCCWMDGERKNYDGYEGMMALSAHRYQEKGRPLVMDNDKSPIYMPNGELYAGKEGRIFSGCFIDMQVEIWAQDNKQGKGLRATLLGVRYAKLGDAFGGGSRPNADDFGEVEDGAEADDIS